MAAMRQLMEVNSFGQVSMSKRFLLLLIQRKDSRLINVISPAGFYTFPNTCAYSASKHALPREMAPWQLRVSSIG